MELTSRLQDRDTSRAKFQVRLEFLQFQIPSMQEQDAGDWELVRKDEVGSLPEDLRKTSTHGRSPEKETKP